MPMSSPEHGTMVRDERDEWPEDEPVGSFDIVRGTMQGRPSVNAHMIFECPNHRRCALLLGPSAERRRTENEPCVWAWDGNEDAPTLTPSINCIAEKDGQPTGGCGWHGFITNGVMR